MDTAIVDTNSIKFDSPIAAAPMMDSSVVDTNTIKFDEAPSIVSTADVIFDDAVSPTPEEVSTPTIPETIPTEVEAPKPITNAKDFVRNIMYERKPGTIINQLGPSTEPTPEASFIKPDTAKQIFEAPKTLGEVGLMLATAGPAWIAGSLGKIGITGYGELTGKDTTEQAEKFQEEVGKAVWQPETEVGKKATELIGKGFEFITTPIKEAAELVGESWNSKTVEAVSQFVVELALFHYGGESIGKAKVKIPEWYNKMSGREQTLINNMVKKVTSAKKAVSLKGAEGILEKPKGVPEGYTVKPEVKIAEKEKITVPEEVTERITTEEIARVEELVEKEHALWTEEDTAFINEMESKLEKSTEKEKKPAPVWEKMPEEELKKQAEYGVEGAKEELAVREVKGKEVVKAKEEPKPIPELKNSEEAIAFGEKATPEQVTELERLYEESQIKSKAFRDTGKLQEALDEGVRGQFFREAVDKAKGVLPERSKIDLAAEKEVKVKKSELPELLKDKVVDEKENAKVISKTKDTIKEKRASSEIAADAPIRFTNVVEVNHMLKTGENFLGKDSGGNLGISASTIPEEFGIVAYGSKVKTPVAIIYPKKAIEGTGTHPNEVKINPAVKLDELKFIVGDHGKLLTLEELRAAAPKVSKKVREAEKAGRATEAEKYIAELEKTNIATKTLIKKEVGKGNTVLYSGLDPTQIPGTLRGLKNSAKDLWEAAETKSATLGKVKRTVRVTVKELKELVFDPASVVTKDPVAKESFKLLINAEEGKNAFLHRNLKLYEDASQGIKKGSESSINIGKVLDGQRDINTLTQKERKAYDFFKDNYDFLINEFARKACGSEEAYKKIVSEVGKEHPKKTKIADLSKERAEEYKTLSDEAKKIRGSKKVSELKGEERIAYKSKQQEMRDFLNKDYIESLSPGEREAHLILSRRIDQYLPHLFDPKELLTIFKTNLEVAQVKLAKATKKGSITKYKNKVNSLTSAITKLEGGEFVAFRQLPKEIFFAFFTKRKGAKGYSFDALKAYETYLHGLARKMFDEPAVKQIAADLYPDIDVGLKPYVGNLVRHYMGYDKHPMDKISNAITTAQWIRTLGFNPRSALVNLSQRVNTVAFVGERYALQAEKMMLFDRKNTNAIFDKTGITREVPSVLTEGPPSVGMKAVNDVARYMFNQMELGNRKHAYLSGYLKGLDTGKGKGLSGEALTDFATKEGIKAVHETQFRYGKLGMAKMYWNPYARIALQFTSYPLKQARFLYRLFKKDKVGFLKYMAYAEGINYTLQELLDMDMSNALGFGITWGEGLNTVIALAEGDTRGALRHAKQTINIGGGLLPSGPGPTVSSALTIAEKAKEGKGVEQLGKELTPIMATRLAQAYKAVRDGYEGKYPIYDSQGHIRYYATGGQVLQRTVGPRPAEEYEASKAYEAKKNLRLEKTEVLKDMTDAFLSNDDETLIKLYERFGIMPSDKQIMAEQEKRNLSEEERRRYGAEEQYQLLREGTIY